MNDVGLPGERRGGLAEQGGNTRQQAETDGIVGPVLAVGIEIGLPGRSNSAGQSSSKSGSAILCGEQAASRQAGCQRGNLRNGWRSRKRLSVPDRRQQNTDVMAGAVQGSRQRGGDVACRPRS
jgi:hypothetical protein